MSRRKWMPEAEWVVMVRGHPDEETREFDNEAAAVAFYEGLFVTSGFYPAMQAAMLRVVRRSDQ